MDDKRIVELYWERSESAIEETAKKYGRYCHVIAYNILGLDEDAEECVNDTYLAAWESIPPHRPSVLSSFLGKLTRRIAIDRVRHRSAEKRGGNELVLALDELEGCISSKSSIEREIEQTELKRAINNFLASLTETERRVFVCRYWYVDSIADIARQFGFSESKVKSMLHRTRQKLHDFLAKEGCL